MWGGRYGGVACVVIAAAAAALIVTSGDKGHPHRRAALGGTALLSAQVVLPAGLPTDRGQLAAGIDRAQAIIDDPSSTGRELASAGLFEQLATGALTRQTASARRGTLGRLGRRAAASMRANLAASAALSGLVTPRKGYPPWKIIRPPAPDTLLGYFRAAQSRFGVGWEYLAAIELIETRFGRVHGLSTAGAQGPMQFLPATWARYGSGNIDNQRDAIFGAARYLVASGAPDDMAGALYHYNPSRDYVSAVMDYAGWLRTDPRAYYGYYYWQVLYAHAGGTVILPVGYPTVRPVPVNSLSGR